MQTSEFYLLVLADHYLYYLASENRRKAARELTVTLEVSMSVVQNKLGNHLNMNKVSAAGIVTFD